MLRSSVIRGLLGTALAVAASAGGSAACQLGPAVSPGGADPAWFGGGAVRLMPLGDSLTLGVGAPGGYRLPLQAELLAKGLAYDFVGSVAYGNPPGTFDPEHEGHGGYRVADLITAYANGQAISDIEGWLAASAPDVVLLHAGTNDMAQPLDWQLAPGHFEELLERAFAASPRLQVVAARIAPTGFDERNLQVETYNRALDRLVRAQVLAGASVYLADVHGALAGIPFDGPDLVHLGPESYGIMANVWASALDELDAPPVPPAEPDPILDWVGALASSEAAPHVAALAADGSGFANGSPWIGEELHAAEGAPGTGAPSSGPGHPLEPANAWRSEPFAIVWQEPGTPVPGESVWFEARLTQAADVSGLQLWSGRAVELADAESGLDWRIYEAARRVSVRTQDAEGVWTDRGELSLRRPPRVRWHPGERFDVEWEDVLRIRLEVVALDSATFDPGEAPGVTRFALSELRLFGTPADAPPAPR